jgi:hypothetical protein
MGFIIVKIGWMVEKLFKKIGKFPSSSPKKKFGKFLMFPYVLACWAESIGILFVEIVLIVEKLFLGVILHNKVLVYSPSVKFGTCLIIPPFSACLPESIGMLILKIVWTVEKLFWGPFLENSPAASLEWNFENCDVFVLFCLLSWIDQ